MSILGDIVDKIEDKINSLLPTYKPFPFVYDYELNDRINDKNYGIRLGTGESISGMTNAVTMDQNVEVFLTQRYSPKKAQGDMDLRVKISDISGDLETLYKELYRRPMAITSASLLIIAPLDLSAPEIDNDNNLVTITLTLSVKYRVAT
jgi:hypothetical protein